jgi:ribonuclease P protein component
MKIETLSKNGNFRRVSARGVSVAYKNFIVSFFSNRLKFNRIGVVASKKVGNAVKRNRARRVIKEAYRMLLDSLQNGFDFVFIARRGACERKMIEIQREIFSACKKNGLIRKQLP